MDKIELQSLVRKKSERVTFMPNSGKTTSDAWKNFVLIAIDGERGDYVKCINCDGVLRWKSRDGTHGLKTHLKYCSKPSTTRTMFDLPGITKAVSVPASVKSSVADSVVTMCAKDIRSFNIVDGDGFKEFVDKVLSVGAKYSGISATDILPSVTTVSRHLAEVVTAMFVRRIQQAESKPRPSRRIFVKTPPL